MLQRSLVSSPRMHSTEWYVQGSRPGLRDPSPPSCTGSCLRSHHDWQSQVRPKDEGEWQEREAFLHFGGREGIYLKSLFFPRSVSGCVNSHCPVFHFELGVDVSSAWGVTPGLSWARSALKLSETAELGPVAGRHQRHRPDRGLRPAAHSFLWARAQSAHLVSGFTSPPFGFHSRALHTEPHSLAKSC